MKIQFIKFGFMFFATVNLFLFNNCHPYQSSEKLNSIQMGSGNENQNQEGGNFDTETPDPTTQTPDIPIDPIVNEPKPPIDPIIVIPGKSTSGLKVAQLALLVNDNDPDSIEIAKYYQQKRGVLPQNIIHLKIPIQESLNRTEFALIKTQIDAALTSNIQAIAIAWTQPFKVECNSITSAISRGFMSGPCDSVATYNTCQFATTSMYYNSTSQKPFTDFNFRPSMMLAGKKLADVKAMIDRGLASDGTQPSGRGLIMNTSDGTRSLRAKIFPSTKLAHYFSPLVNVEVLAADTIADHSNVLFYFQGLLSVQLAPDKKFPPGAIADHLTSYGGSLVGGYGGQMSCLDFISAGATGTFGTVSEPCAYAVKFPDPSIMILKYMSGETLIEAYWKSISQTFQGVFVGEPLANPWMKTF